MKRTLDADEDIRAEAAALAARGGHSAGDGAAASQLPGDGGHAREPMEEAVAHPFVVHQLNWRPGGHRPNAATLSMLDEIGGIDGLQSFTARFYSKAFQDPTLDPLIRDRADPHGSRFANWIAEKFGHRDEPWTTERSTRATCPFASHGYSFTTPHDRSSAHYAAWHSPKRDGGRFGEHFKLDDCRVWMRLHFWALRDAGLDARSPSFFSYYVKFIGHFVSVYERSAPCFARSAARWSADPANIEAYLSRGRRMEDALYAARDRSSLPRALAALPADEQARNVGSAPHGWPYRG
jgi:hypothetical protein